jgi:CheY-like chemotaxis protein
MCVIRLINLVKGGSDMNSAATPSCVPTLLVISSDRANMQLMTQLIATRGDLTLRTAPNGMDGIELASSVQPAVVVMDTELSDTCAKEVLKGLKGNPHTSRIPVVAVSSEAFPAQVQAGLKAGFYRYLTKPYKLPDLMDAIDDSLGYTSVA